MKLITYVLILALFLLIQSYDIIPFKCSINQQQGIKTCWGSSTLCTLELVFLKTPRYMMKLKTPLMERNKNMESKICQFLYPYVTSNFYLKPKKCTIDMLIDLNHSTVVNNSLKKIKELIFQDDESKYIYIISIIVRLIRDENLQLLSSLTKEEKTLYFQYFLPLQYKLNKLLIPIKEITPIRDNVMLLFVKKYFQIQITKVFNGEDCKFSPCMVGIEGDNLSHKAYVLNYLYHDKNNKPKKLLCKDQQNKHMELSFKMKSLGMKSCPKNSVYKKSSHVAIKDIEAIQLNLNENDDNIGVETIPDMPYFMNFPKPIIKTKEKEKENTQPKEKEKDSIKQEEEEYIKIPFKSIGQMDEYSKKQMQKILGSGFFITALPRNKKKQKSFGFKQLNETKGQLFFAKHLRLN